KYFYAVGSKHFVMCHNDKVFDLGLCNKHAIKGVMVMRRQVTSSQGMLSRDRELDEIVGRDFLVYAVSSWINPAELCLDGNFPNRCCANVDQRGLVSNRLAGFLAKFYIVAKPPEKSVSVQQEPFHFRSPRNAAAMSSGKGASKSGAISIFPFNRPGRRVTPLSGTSFATGLPFLAITICSPAATRSSKRDK